jgi:hypothetical protein
MGGEFLDGINKIYRIGEGGKQDQITKFSKLPNGEKAGEGSHGGLQRVEEEKTGKFDGIFGRGN